MFSYGSCDKNQLPNSNHHGNVQQIPFAGFDQSVILLKANSSNKENDGAPGNLNTGNKVSSNPSSGSGNRMPPRYPASGSQMDMGRNPSTPGNVVPSPPSARKPDSVQTGFARRYTPIPHGRASTSCMESMTQSEGVSNSQELHYYGSGLSKSLTSKVEITSSGKITQMEDIDEKYMSDEYVEDEIYDTIINNRWTGRPSQSEGGRNNHAKDEQRSFEEYGRRGESEHVNTRSCVPEKYIFKENVDAVYCGKDYCIALTDKCRNLWIHGSNPYVLGALGIPMPTNNWISFSLNYRRTSSLSTKEYIKTVACGEDHVLIVISTSHGKSLKGTDVLVTFGRNRNCQLGYKSEKMKTSGTKKESTEEELSSWKQWMARKQSSSGSQSKGNAPVIPLGTRSYSDGSQGLPDFTGEKCKGQYDISDDGGERMVSERMKRFSTFKSIDHIACGSSFSVVVAHGGSIFTCGENGRGQCGLGYVSECCYPFKKVQLPPLSRKGRSLNQLLSTSKTHQITHVACGGDHTIVVSLVNGRHRVYAWGYNKYGQCGERKNDKSSHIISTPIEVVHPLLRSVKLLACGGNSTIFVTGENQILICGNNRCYQLCKNPMENPRSIISSIMVERKAFQITHDITSVAMGSNHCVYTVKEKPPTDTYHIRRNEGSIPGVSSVDIISTVWNNLLGSKHVLSSNSHAKIATFFMITGMFPPVCKNTIEHLVTMLHTIRISLKLLERCADPERATLSMVMYSIFQRMETIIHEGISKYLNEGTVSSILKSIDLVSGFNSAPESLHKEFDMCLQFVREKGLKNCHNYEEIPPYMRIMMNKLYVDVSKMELPDTSKQNFEEPPVDDDGFNVKARNYLLHNRYRTADCFIVYKKDVFPFHSLYLAMISDSMNARMSLLLGSPERSHYFSRDAAFVKTVYYLASNTSQLFQWNNPHDIDEEVHESRDIPPFHRNPRENVNPENLLFDNSPFVIPLEEHLEKEVSVEVVKKVLDYLYTGNIDITMDTAEDIYHVWSAIFNPEYGANPEIIQRCPVPQIALSAKAKFNEIYVNSEIVVACRKLMQLNGTHVGKSVIERNCFSMLNSMKDEERKQALQYLSSNWREVVTEKKDELGSKVDYPTFQYLTYQYFLQNSKLG